TGFKDLHILFSVNIYCHTAASALRVSHLSKHSSVRTCNSFNGIIGSVYIPLFILCNISLRIAIACSHLTIFKQLLDRLFRSHESSFSMGCRIDIYAAKLGFRKPRGFIRYYLCVNHFGDMASDSIVGQRRGLSVLSGNLSVRNQPQLNKCLESVTYAECQPVSFIQQLLYCFLKLCILECRSKEFCGAVRLI